MSAFFYQMQQIPWLFSRLSIAVCAWALLQCLALLFRIGGSSQQVADARFRRIGFGLLAANTLAFIFSETIARKVHLDVLLGNLHVDPSQTALLLAEATSAEYIGLWFWSTSSLFGVGVYSFVVFIHRRSQAVPRWLVLTLALFGIVAASALQRGSALAYRGYHGESEAPHMRERIIEGMITESLIPMDRALWVIALVCLLLTSFWVWRDLKYPEPAPSDLRGPLLVLAAGLFCFCLTRGHHVDAHNVLRPRLSAPCDCGLGYDEHAVLPLQLGARSGEFLQAPNLLIESNTQGSIYGARADLHELGVNLVNRRELWEQLKPGVDFPGNIVLGVPHDLPMKDVAPWLSEVEASGYPHLYALVAAPVEEFNSGTLGTIQRAPTCSTLPVDAVYLPGATWGEHVAGAR